jgi:hypothetical protein
VRWEDVAASFKPKLAITPKAYDPRSDR